MEMVEAVIEKLWRLSVKGIGGDIGVSEVVNLASALEQMQSLLKIHEKQQRLWLLLCGHDYDHEFDDLVKELVYEADHLADKILYHGLHFQHDKKNIFMRSLLDFLSVGFCPPTEKEGAADLTRRIRLVNARLLRKTAKAVDLPSPHHPQGQRGSGDRDDDDNSDDIWNKGDSAVAPVDDDFVVGGEDAIEEVICGLLSDDGKNRNDLKIISICGMGGIGKTTLARKLVYQDYSVRHHFDCIAWATVGKSFRARHVLEDLLLQHLFLNREDMNPYSDLDLAQKLYEFLQHKRYLIVLDDVWSTDAWVCLRIAFPPREATGSRVLLTTRDTLVPERIAASFHNMRTTLDQDGDWELLRRTAFRGDKPLTFYSVVHY